MTEPPMPRFRELDRAECEALLARNCVGRVAYSYRDRVDVEPIHYVYHDGWLYGRTTIGTKIDRIERNRWVAFEVDEVDGLFDWRSVVVHGGFYLLSPEGPDWEREAWATALAQIRTLVPQAFSPDDPTPFRTLVFRIAVQEITGRAASPAPAG